MAVISSSSSFDNFGRSGCGFFFGVSSVLALMTNATMKIAINDPIGPNNAVKGTPATAPMINASAIFFMPLLIRLSDFVIA